jgi:hypothetical protein
MDNSVDKSKSIDYQPGPFPAALRSLFSIVTWPIGFFMLTEADKSKAGIYLGGEGRDEKSQTASIQLDDSHRAQ